MYDVIVVGFEGGKKGGVAFSMFQCIHGGVCVKKMHSWEEINAGP